MKICHRCEVNKEDTEFNKSSRNKDKLHSYCRECQKEHYNGNKVNHSKNVRKNEKKRLENIRQLVVDRFKFGCVDCGNSDIRVLEFDHLRDKINNISAMIRSGNATTKIIAEMDKCEVRCKNCHSIKTLERLGNSWHDKYLLP